MPINLNVVGIQRFNMLIENTLQKSRDTSNSNRYLDPLALILNSVLTTLPGMNHSKPTSSKFGYI